MRILLALFIWLFFIGGLWSYMQHRPSPADNRAQAAVCMKQSEQIVDLVVTPTFSPEKDPFALDIEDSVSTGNTGFELRVNGTSVPLSSSELTQGKPYHLHAVPDIVQGRNEIFLQAAPPVQEAGRAQGIRLQIFSDAIPIAETTFWSDGGAVVSGTLPFFLHSEEARHDQH